MPKVYMSWHGGNGFSFPELDDYTEHRSVAAAVRYFETQVHPEVYCCYPDTEGAGGPTALLYIGAPNDGTGCPDRKLSFGPRGGVKVEHC